MSWWSRLGNAMRSERLDQDLEDEQRFMEAFSMSHQWLRQAVLPDAGGAEEKLRVQFVSGNAFPALGVTAALGRVVAPSDDVTLGDTPSRSSAMRSGHGGSAAIRARSDSGFSSSDGPIRSSVWRRADSAARSRGH